jgi:acyl carrier protein
MRSIENKVLEIIKRLFNIKEKEIDKKLLKEGNVEGWDSLGHLNLLMELEKEFNIKFSLDDIEKTRTFEDIIDLIKRKINEEKN